MIIKGTAVIKWHCVKIINKQNIINKINKKKLYLSLILALHQNFFWMN